MDIRARPVKQIIICGCDAKFENETDLKVHLNFYHKGDTEVKVRVQKVYLNSPPKSTQSSKNEASEKPVSIQKSSQNTNVQIQNTIRQQKTNVQGENMFVSRQNTNVQGKNTFVSKQNTNVQEQNTIVQKKNSNVQKFPSPIVINKKSIISNIGTNQFAVFKTGDNKFIVKNNMFSANGVQFPVRDNVQVATTSKLNVQSTPKHVQVASAARVIVQSTPKFVQVASAARVNVLATPKHVQVASAARVVQATPKRLSQATVTKPKKPIIVSNRCFKFVVPNNNVNVAKPNQENLTPMYLISGKHPNETYQRVIVQNVGEESHEITIKEDPLYQQGGDEDVYKLEEIQDTEYKIEVGNNGYVQDGNDTTEDGNDDAEMMDDVDVQDTEFQLMNSEVFEQEFIQHGNEIEVEGKEIIVEGNDVTVNDVKSEVESEETTGNLEEPTDCKEEMDENDSQPTVAAVQVVTGPSTIVVNSENSQEEFHYCDLCGKTFDKERSLRYHKSRYHKIRTGPPELFPCSLCNRSFKSEKSVQMHKTKTHGLPPQKSSKKKGQKEGGFPCTYCEKTLSCKNSQICHERLHTGERPYPCTYCDKKFVNPTNLQTHIRIHTKERPFVCEICQMTFNQIPNMKRHQRSVHSGIQPYSCWQCGKKFSQSNSMKLHILTVHLKQPTPYKSQSRAAIQERRKRKALALLSSKQETMAAPITISQIPLDPSQPIDDVKFDEESVQYEEVY